MSAVRYQENAALESEAASTKASLAAAQASMLETKLNLLLVQNQVEQLLGECPN